MTDPDSLLIFTTDLRDCGGKTRTVSRRNNVTAASSPSTKSWLTRGVEVADGKRTSAPATRPLRAILNCTWPAAPPVDDASDVSFVNAPSPWSRDSTDQRPCRSTCTECHAPSDTLTALRETSLSPPPDCSPRLYRRRITPSTICRIHHALRALVRIDAYTIKKHASSDRNPRPPTL